MISLEDSNKLAREEWEEKQKPPRNGIACPQCLNELRDSDKIELMSNPPQRNVHCENCGYKGYRVA